MLKIALFGIAVAVAGILGFAATRPDTFRVQRTASVKAPPAEIFPLINDLRGGEQWSPYYRKDPAMSGTYSGPASGPGATFDFAGNQDVGSGRVTITGSEPPGRVSMRLQMFKPFAADNIVEFTLVPRGEATDVTWAMQGRQPFLAKLMGLFVDMDKMVGTDFAAGLASLKQIVETRAGPVPVVGSVGFGTAKSDGSDHRHRSPISDPGSVIPLAGLQFAAEDPEHEHRVAEHHRQQQRRADQHEHL